MANATIVRFPKSFSKKIKIDRNEVLGVGNSSVVFRGTYEDKNVAVKRIELRVWLTPNEFSHYAKLQHENVIKILTVEEDCDFRYIAMELCTGTLLQVLEKTYNGPPLPPDLEVLLQIIKGLEYIHFQKLVHRDIKPENILVSKEGTMKLADWVGFEKQVTEEKSYLSGLKGTLLWMAPECFPSKRDETDIEKAQKIDIFSCGCVFFVFLMRKKGAIHPFGDIIDHLQIHVSIREGKPINIHKLKNNPHLVELIQNMIQFKPIDRISAQKVKALLCRQVNNKPYESSKTTLHKENLDYDCYVSNWFSNMFTKKN